jgi:hypothetical protein
MFLPQLRECPKPVAADPVIPGARLLRLLLEGVKDVDRFRSRCQVEHSMLTGDVNPDLTNARSDRLHRLPIVGIQFLLHTPQLEASQPTRESRECPKVTPRAADPDERFVRHRSRRQYTSFGMALPAMRHVVTAKSG